MATTVSSAASAAVVSSVPQGAASASASSAASSALPAQQQQTGGIWSSARQLFSLAQPKIGKDGDFSFTFLTSPQRSKPAATVNADNFYMYACGSINMP